MTMRTVQRVVRAPRRNRQWGITHVNGSIVVATDAGSMIVDLGSALETFLGNRLANVTVSAIRIQIQFDFQATAVVGDRVAGAWGITVVSNAAFETGAAAISDPTGDDADWMAYGAWSLIADAAAVISRPRDGTIVIKNDSMRKMREANRALVLKLRPSQIDDPISIFVAGRVLFLL